MVTGRSIENARSEQRGIARAAASQATAAIGGVSRLMAWLLATLRRPQALAGRRRDMQLVETLALGNRRQLMLVVCDGRRYLLGVGADSVGSILAIEQGAVPADQPRPAVVTPGGPINCVGRRPELVRQRLRQIPPEPKPGADRWQ